MYLSRDITCQTDKNSVKAILVKEAIKNCYCLDMRTQSFYYLVMTEWFGLEGIFEDHLKSSPPATARDIFHLIRLPKAPRNLTTNSSNNEISETSGQFILLLHHPQCVFVCVCVCVRVFFLIFNLNLPTSSHYHLVLSLWALVKCLPPYFF